MCVGESAVCVGDARAPGGRPPLRGRAEDRDRGRPAGELNGRMGLGFGRLSGRAGGAGLAGWRTGWWSVVLACSLGGSVGSGRLRGPDGPDRACLARLGSACDCVCLECVCVGRSPLKDRLQA